MSRGTYWIGSVSVVVNVLPVTSAATMLLPLLKFIASMLKTVLVAWKVPPAWTSMWEISPPVPLRRTKVLLVSSRPPLVTTNPVVDCHCYSR